MIRSYRHEFDPARYPLFYLMEQVPEDNVQNSTMAMLSALGIPAVTTDVGAKLLRGRAVGLATRAGASREEIARMNAGATGAGKKGLTDVVGTLPGGRALFLEIKAPAWLEPSPKTGRMIQKKAAGKPKPDQLDFMDVMAAAGAVVGVVWHLKDLQEILDAAKIAR